MESPYIRLRQWLRSTSENQVLFNLEITGPELEKALCSWLWQKPIIHRPMLLALKRSYDHDFDLGKTHEIEQITMFAL